MEKIKTYFTDIQELYSYVMELHNHVISKENIIELRAYINSSGLILPEDRNKLLQMVDQIKCI